MHRLLNSRIGCTRDLNKTGSMAVVLLYIQNQLITQRAQFASLLFDENFSWVFILMPCKISYAIKILSFCVQEIHQQFEPIQRTLHFVILKGHCFVQQRSVSISF